MPFIIEFRLIPFFNASFRNVSNKFESMKRLTVDFFACRLDPLCPDKHIWIIQVRDIFFVLFVSQNYSFNFKGKDENPVPKNRNISLIPFGTLWYPLVRY
jgi:hypothetical protein